MASQWEQVRSFLVNAWPTWTVYARFRRFLHHVITHIFAFAHPRAIMAALRRDSKVADDVAVKRQMVHLKTKEECRLGNETIQVWTIELPSKHAEGVLKYAFFHHRLHRPILTVPQSDQGGDPRPGQYRLATSSPVRKAQVFAGPCSRQTQPRQRYLRCSSSLGEHTTISHASLEYCDLGMVQSLQDP